MENERDKQISTSDEATNRYPKLNGKPLTTVKVSLSTKSFFVFSTHRQA